MFRQWSVYLEKPEPIRFGYGPIPDAAEVVDIRRFNRRKKELKAEDVAKYSGLLSGLPRLFRSK